MKIDLSGKTINQPSNDFFAELMGAGTNGGDIKQIDIALLDDFVGQPFKPYSPERLALLAEDIKENGVLSPLIIKPINNGRYQILAGHNRKNAAIIAGLAKVPCIVKEVDEDGAKLILVNTNLNQRQELLPSEKAFAYKMQWEITKGKENAPI